jgi:hypothetical protein
MANSPHKANPSVMVKPRFGGPTTYDAPCPHRVRVLWRSLLALRAQLQERLVVHVELVQLVPAARALAERFRRVRQAYGSPRGCAPKGVVSVCRVTMCGIPT